jgi:hypothetical protein
MQTSHQSLQHHHKPDSRGYRPAPNASVVLADGRTAASMKTRPPFSNPLSTFLKHHALFLSKDTNLINLLITNKGRDMTFLKEPDCILLIRYSVFQITIKYTFLKLST